MKKRTKLSVTIASAVLSTALIFSCTKNDQSQTRANKSDYKSLAAVHTYTSEEYFRSIFYAEGAFADNLPVLNYYRTLTSALSPEDRASREAFLDVLVSSIQTSNPNFFTDFGNDLTSGNLTDIHSALQAASQYVVEFNLTEATSEFSEYTYGELLALTHKDPIERTPEENETLNALNSPTVIWTVLPGAMSLADSRTSQSDTTITAVVLAENLYEISTTLAGMDLEIAS